MADFAVAHRAFRQTHVFAAGVDKAVREFSHECIIHRRIGTLDGVIFVFGTVGIESPAVADNQYEWFFLQRCLSFHHKKEPFKPK